MSISLETLVPAILASSATAASLLVAVLAFLHNVLWKFQQKYHEARVLYHRILAKHDIELQRKLGGTVVVRPVGGAGTRGEIDYTWRIHSYDPAPSGYTAPGTLAVDLFDLWKPFLAGDFTSSVDPQSLLAFDDSTIDSIIKEELVDHHSYFKYVWTFIPHSATPSIGTLYVQSILLSRAPKRNQSLSRTLKAISVPIILFITAIVFSIMSVTGPEYELLAVGTYIAGWISVLYVLKMIMALVPVTKRMKEWRSSPELSMNLPPPRS